MKLKYISDSRIIEMSTRNGKVGLLSTWKDLTLAGGLKVNDIRPVPGGVYDRSIFGSINANTKRFDDYSRYGAIQLPVKYCMGIRKPQLIKFLKSKGILLAEEYDGENYVGNKDFFKVFKASSGDVLDYIQFNILGSNILATQNITDSTKCSYEGLIQAFRDLGDDTTADVIETQFVNQYVQVLPIADRKFSIRVVDGVATPNNDKLTQAYRYLLYGIEKYNEALKLDKFNADTEEANANLALLDYKLRQMASSISGSSSLIKGGHDNFSRKMQRSRLNGSMRAVIVPDPTLQIDEIGLPLHLAYEMCDKEFIEYLMLNFGISKAQALVRFNRPYEGNTLSIFSKYIEGKRPKWTDEGKVPEVFTEIEWIEDPMGPKYAIINRQPTLHQLSMLSCRIKLTKDNAIKYPLLLCAPLNAITIKLAL